MHDIKRVDYLVIDAEGHEPLIIQGMKLENEENRRKFSAFQIELGLVLIPSFPHTLILSHSHTLILHEGFG